MKILSFENVNLALEYRKKKQFIIYGGFYMGSNMNQWQKLILQEFMILDNGVPCYKADDSTIFKLRARSLISIADLPAFCEIHCQSGHTGMNGCEFK